MHTARILVATALAAACTCALAQKAGSTSAPDVVTIDQTKAVNRGITSGDGAGFPVTLSQPGSYKLMSNLVVPAGVDGIVATVPGVTIDLNGFSITGPGTCTGVPASISCSATGTHGITAAIGAVMRLAVRNGQVTGFGTCVDGRYGARLADLSMSDCDTAFSAFEGSVVSRVAVLRSGRGAFAYGANVEGVQMWGVRYGMATNTSALRGISMSEVYQAFSLGSGANSALSLAMINATVLGSGVQSVGANLCNGVAC